MTREEREALIRDGEQRQAYRDEIARLRLQLEIEDRHAQRLVAERREETARAEKAEAKAARYEQDWYAAKQEFGDAAAKMRAHVERLRASWQVLLVDIEAALAAQDRRGAGGQQVGHDEPLAYAPRAVLFALRRTAEAALGGGQ